MKQKSLRQLARELGVSASYLSQVKNGKKKPSSKMVNMLTSVNLAADSQCMINSQLAAGESSSGRTADSGLRHRNSYITRKRDRQDLLTKFLKSRRQGISPQTTKFYQGYLTRSLSVIGTEIAHQDVTSFLDSLSCSLGGKSAYYRSLRAFYRWLYSPKSGYDLNSQNPILLVESPKKEKRIMPSITETQLDVLVTKADNLRDKVILHLLFDSGMRLSELANIKHSDFDFDTHPICLRASITGL